LSRACRDNTAAASFLSNLLQKFVLSNYCAIIVKYEKPKPSFYAKIFRKARADKAALGNEPEKFLLILEGKIVRIEGVGGFVVLNKFRQFNA
jgi:hypothetical protein